MSATRTVESLGAILMLAGCGTLSAQPELPAVIAPSTAQSRAELARVLAEAFRGTAVTLADDALTHDSVLIIERREPRDPAGRPLSGRVLEMPEQFRLVVRDSRCTLIRQSDGRRWELKSATCVPNPDPRRD